MEYLDIVRKRYSVRSYKPDRVEKEKIDIILEAARLAPTASNRQAFKIFVIDTARNREELRKIYSRSWLFEAPLLICVCAIPGENWVRKDNKNYSDVDSAIVMDHIIMAATDQGLGTCWVGAFNLQAARRALGIDDTMEPIAFTPLGYARETTTVNKIRKSLADIVVYK